MTTRLDRLLLLLSTGSTPIVRQTAAKQLGSIAAQRIARPSTSTATSSAPYRGLDGEWNEVVNLLVKVLPFLRSKQWETRSAAASAVEYIVKAAGIWDPLTYASNADLNSYGSEPTSALRDLNLTQLILEGKHLLASSGNEYAGGPSGSSGKQELVKSLGLNVPGAGDDELGLDVEEELRAGALQSNGSTNPNDNVKGKGKMESSPAPPVKQEEENLSHLSARERNAIKRKRKLTSQGSISSSAPPPKARKLESGLPSTSTSESSPSISESVKKEEIDESTAPETVIVAYKGPRTGQAPIKESDDEQGSWLPPPNEWPFKQILASLQEGLLHKEWEIRHGSALGIREILKVQGRSGGMAVDLSLQQNQALHQSWTDSLAVDLLTVLALDRFGDFVGDQVVAPVRETASQTLSALVVHMSEASVLRVLELLSLMVRQDEVKAELERQAVQDPDSRRGKRNYYWEVKHAGLLGMKYLVAVRRDLFDSDKAGEPDSLQNGNLAMHTPSSRQSRIENVLDTAILGLSDKDDDVRSVAASVLLPLANVVVETLPQDKTLLLLDMLYMSLGDLRDDLSSSVGNVMDLLSRLLQFSSILEQIQWSAGRCVRQKRTGLINAEISCRSSRSLAVLVPLLFPFFRHTIVSVRKAVIDAIVTFIRIPHSSIAETSWLDIRLLRMLFQNIIVEEDAGIRAATQIAWLEAIDRISFKSVGALQSLIQPLLPAWLDILMTPVGQSINTNFFWKPAEYDANATGAYAIDKAVVKQDLALVSVEQIIKGRLAASEALAAALCRYPPESHEEMVGPLLGSYMTSASSHQLSFAAIIVTRWAELLAEQTPEAQSPLLARLAPLVVTGLASDPAVSYSETVGLLTQIHTHCSQLLGICKSKGKIAPNHLPVLDPPHQGFSLARAQQLAGVDYQALLLNMVPKARSAARPLLDELSHRIQTETLRTTALKEAMDIQVFSSLAGAVVALKQIPTKLNPLIRSLMNGIKFETNPDLQVRTAGALASFIALCNEAGASMKTNPSDKIIKNVCSFLCQEPTITPLFSKFKATSKGILSTVDVSGADVADTLQATQKGKGKNTNVSTPKDDSEDEECRKAKLVRRGAEYCLQQLAARFGDRLFEQVPRLWIGASQVLASTTADGLDAFDNRCSSDDVAAQEVLDSLTVLAALCSAIPASLAPRVLALLPHVILTIQSKYAVIRFAAVRCMATVCDKFPQEALKSVVLDVIPFIADPSSTVRRRGAMELIACIVDRLDIRILPYITFLVVPVLGRMTDSDEETRVLATKTFASLVKLVPLEADMPDPPGFPEELLQKRDEERKFLLQLLGGGKVEDYELPIKVSVKLRKYQQDGINWLAFLARYQLHGILCDDMGLGKTLQTICILGSKIKERASLYAATNSPSAVHLPSLVVCPPTLVGHWRHEIQTYVPELSCTIYGGDRQERLRRAAQLKRFDIVITSYDVVRNDIEALQPVDWNYCVLDEGHIIKNGKTKLSKAIKTVHANHRLILSGTPIQNNVLELWNLFDFLMPGFLGTEEAFNRRYGKPIQQSRDAKSSSRDQESGALALEALHKQVLPFILRRLKEDVLDDLPPKIIQDYYCDLSPLQRDLYESFTKSGDDEQDGLVSKVEDDEEAKPPKLAANGQETHVFQTLQYLRRLVNHPSLVIKPERQDHQRILAKHGLIGPNQGKVDDITQAPKLTALKQLLIDNGLGVKAESTEEAKIDLSSDSAVAPHRVLIFCQLKSMLDLIENSLFAKHLPSISYMRLDGSTPPHKRHSVVQTFNADPSIDVLLLTTHVGGLGLNLTGADTVIFVEHDWNPMRDLQAMDRAHRLGQKRVVNVYRLITKGTLEEKIMGLQRFKMNIASTVVSQQNADLATMDTENVLDLFSGQDESEKGKQTKEGKLSQKEILQNLQELDDVSDDYKDFGDASDFAKSL